MSEENCKICKASKKDGVLLYNAPKELQRRTEWSAACGVTLTKSSVVCQNHFKEKDFYGRKKNLNSDALPTENIGDRNEPEVTTSLQTAATQNKTEPPEFVNVTSSNPISLAAETSISIKEEPIDSFQSFTFIDEDCFDEHTDNPIGTTEDGNYGTLFNELENKVLTCGRIVMEIEKNGDRKYGLVCSYCKYTLLTSNQSFWEKFLKHLTNHDLKITPVKENDDHDSGNFNSMVGQNHSMISVEEERKETTKATKQENVCGYEKNATFLKNYDNDNNAKKAESAENTDEDKAAYDEIYEPKAKKYKRTPDDTLIEPHKSTDGIISFDHPDEKCITALLELLKDNSILWLPRQSIMKICREALLEVSTIFNERFPKYAMSKEQLCQSIDRIKYLYQRGSDEKQKRRTKSSAYKIKYPEYFKLCAAIEANSRNLKQSCDLCWAVFYRPVDMQIHKVKIHKVGELPFKCQRCGYAFACPAKLASHEEKHNRVKKFICEFCNQTFYYESKLRDHIYFLHTEDSKQICEICGQKFSSPKQYKRHKLHHEAPKEKCEVCGKSFFEKRALSEHMKSHLNERNYECEICGKKFNRRNGVTIHKRSVHKNKAQSFWIDGAMSTSYSEWVSHNRSLVENGAEDSHSNSSTHSSANLKQITYPVEMLHSFLK